jgi:hypothetical protein
MLSRVPSRFRSHTNIRPIRIRVGKGAQQHRFDDAEDCRRGADGQAEVSTETIANAVNGEADARRCEVGEEGVQRPSQVEGVRAGSERRESFAEHPEWAAIALLDEVADDVRREVGSERSLEQPDAKRIIMWLAERHRGRWPCVGGL